MLLCYLCVDKPNRTVAFIGKEFIKRTPFCQAKNLEKSNPSLKGGEIPDGRSSVVFGETLSRSPAGTGQDEDLKQL